MLFAVTLGALLAVPTAQAGVTSSSFKAETKLGTNYWNGTSAVDGKMDTCWQLPGESANRGESLMFDVPKGDLDKVGIMVGWAKSDETYKDFARVKELRIEAFTMGDDQSLKPVGSATVKVEDKMEWQVVDFDDIAVGEDMFGGKVKVTVTDIYPGVDYPNLAMSEILLYLKEFDAAPTIDEVSGEADGHISMDMTDDNVKTFWAADAKGASISFSASGYGLASVGLTAGPKDYARPKKVEVIAGGRTSVTELPDAPGAQWIQIPAVTGYTGSAWGDVQINILEVYPGAKFPDQVAVSELDLHATTYEGL